MRRGGRRSDPIVPKILRVELDGGNVPLRLVCVGIAIAVAALAFGYFVNELLTPATGWQKIDPTNSRTGANTQFVLSYDIGRNGGATGEYRQVSTTFTDVSDDMYRLLSDVPMAPYVNLSDLNRAPNTAIQVDDRLYAALETLEKAGNRDLYYAPIRESYESLFGCQTDADAKLFDPAYSDEMSDFIRQVAAFAADPEAVSIQLLPEHSVMLSVSPAYLEFAQEYELESFVSFGWMRNAFILDAVADALIQRGLCNGVIASVDGFTRTLGDGDFSVQLFGLDGRTAVPFATGSYSGAQSSVYYHSYPLTAQDSERYYVYADGTLRAPYMNRQGELSQRCADWFVLSGTQSCTQLLLETLPMYTGDREVAAGAYSQARTNGNEILVNGDALTVTPQRPGVSVRAGE